MTRKRTTTSRVASSRVVDDLKIIRGVGPLYEKHLHAAGIRTFAQFAKLSPEDVATHLPNLSASQIRKQGWVLQARKLASKKTETKSRRKKATIPTTSQHYENFTIEFLLNEKNNLRRLRIVHVQSGDVETWANWQTEEVSHFLARHTGIRIPEGKLQSQEAPPAKTKPSLKAKKSVKSVKQKAKQNRTSVKKSKKAETLLAPEVNTGQAKSVKPEGKESRSSARKPVDKPIVETPPKEITQTYEAQTVPKVEQDQAKPAPVETSQSKSSAPILFGPAAEVLAKRFHQKSMKFPVPNEIKQQADSSHPEFPQSQAVRETNGQMGAIRLLQWNNLMADSDQPVQSLPHDQRFDIKLMLDISSLPMPTKSQLEITGILLAKKLGTREHKVIGETQVVATYSPIINLRVGTAALEQGLYRLEAEVKLNDPDAVSLPKVIDTIFQGGLFQVY